MMASLRRTLARLLGFVRLGPSEKVIVEVIGDVKDAPADL
jgi:hypothetical protein